MKLEIFKLKNLKIFWMFLFTKNSANVFKNTLYIYNSSFL